MTDCSGNTVKALDISAAFNKISVSDVKKGYPAYFEDLRLPRTVRRKAGSYLLKRNSEGYDSAECRGQTVSVSANGRYLYLLGYSNYGDFRDELLIETRGGRLKGGFGFIDMCSDRYDSLCERMMDYEAEAGGLPCVRFGRFKSGMPQFFKSLSMYQCVIDMKEEKHMISLTLPENSFITVLAAGVV